MARVVELNRHNETATALALMRTGEGQRLMEAIRREMDRMVQETEAELARNEENLQENLRLLLALIVGGSVLGVLFALVFAYALYAQLRQRMQGQIHLDTQQALRAQEETSRQLLLANGELRDSKELIAVTFKSIGDAVMTTDALACVTSLNPVAERLTGFTEAEAAGRPVGDIFHIISKLDRSPASIPVAAALERGTVQGLANHTVLIARDGSEYDIADSCAPIRNREQQIIGAVLVFRDVTSEYKAQQGQRDNAARVQTILDTVVDGIITIHGSGSQVESVNHAAELIFGYTAAEINGQDLGLLIPELGQSSGLLKRYKAGETTPNNVLGHEVVGRRKDGSLVPLEIAVGEMLMDGQRFFTGVLRDLTARKQIESAKTQADQQLRESEERFRTLADNISQLAWMADAQGSLFWYNQRWFDYTGTTLEEMHGWGWQKVHHPDHEQRVVESFKHCLETGETWEGTFPLRGTDGKYRWFLSRALPIRDEHGVVLRWFGTNTDITERVKTEGERVILEQRLRENVVELEKAKTISEKANLAKSDFLSSMSHELRSPLNAILGFAQLMESDAPAPSPGQKASIDQILHAGWYLLELINEVLDLAVIESGRLSISLEPVPLADVMLECQAMIEPQAVKRGIGMTFPCFTDPCFIKADRTRLKQVLINLLSNSIKYNQAGGKVSVAVLATGNGRIRISVTDTGVGLNAEQIDQLFQPFNRLGQETGSEEGTGIGLVVSKRLVELMLGRIGVDSHIGSGSTFWIEMQADSDPGSRCFKSQSAAVAALPPAVLQQRVLLYVEDNMANLGSSGSRVGEGRASGISRSSGVKVEASAEEEDGCPE